MRNRRTLAGFALALAAPCSIACGGQEFTASAGDAGAADASEAAAPFCGPQTVGVFACSDFDEKPLPEYWNDLLTSGGAAPVVEDDGASVSSPHSLLATAPALAAGATASQAFVTTTSLPKGGVHIAFEMRVDALSFPPNATGATIVPALYTQGKYEIILAFAPSTTGPFAFVMVELSGATVAALDAGGGEALHDLTPLFAGAALGSWESIKLDLDIDKGQRTATITVGSKSMVVTLNPPLGTASGDRSFSIGLQATPPTNAAKFRFDNVTYSPN